MMEEDELQYWRESERYSINTSSDPIFKIVENAIEGDQWLDIIYFGGDNPGQTRNIKPLELYGVEGYSDIYLRAFCSIRKEERTFRLDRLTILMKEPDSQNSASKKTSAQPLSDEGKILKLLAAAPGLKASQIATEIGLEKRQVNHILYGRLKGKISQDKSYRWWPRTTQQIQQVDSQLGPKDTTLARVCQYYLDCLSQDDETGISVFASSRFSLDYAPISELPLLDGTEVDLLENESAKKLLNKVQSDRSRLQLYLGYPTRLNMIHSRKGWEGLMVEPIFLFPFYFDPQNRNEPPKLSIDMPQINYKVLRSLSTTDSGNVIDEAIQLSEELGLNNPHADIPDIDDLIARLKLVRDYWDWREEPDPFTLCTDPALSTIKQPGIYNRAVLLAGERSPYTQGLETELAALTQLDENAFQNTALGAWLQGNIIEGTGPSDEPLLEVLPLNTEERQSVVQSLSNPLTVITGPPGTGKSQVVGSLLINAAWQGKKVLFASKNNKAVDVVEIRTNAIGPRPILLRLGANEYQSKLAMYLTSLLAATATHEDEIAYQSQVDIHDTLRERFKELDDEVNRVITLRNNVDQLEQGTEQIRTTIGDDLFQSFFTCDLARLRLVATALSLAAHKADVTRQSFFYRILWPLIRNGRYAQLGSRANQSTYLFETIHLTPPKISPSDGTISEWRKFSEEISQRIRAGEQVQHYFEKLQELTETKQLETLSHEYIKLVNEISDSSEQLWQCWLRLRPNDLTQQERKLLGEYSALLQMIVASNEKNQTIGAKVFRQYHTLFPQITDILSCWAVTSLSARGRIPLEPAFFDLLVIDEASQCDIASALPLLYRSKQAVIIGDPQQLKHISRIPPRQDRTLLAKHNLVEGYATWAYSVNSLFDLARSLCRSEDIVMLRDHHRSHADIIKFSNEHFYEGRLRIATKYERLKMLHKDQPAVRWNNVKGHVIRPPTGGALNTREAVAVVKEIERLVVQQGYHGSIGVVTPFRSQANKIRDLVQQNESLIHRLAEMEFLADTVHRFQGDERDLMIFSPVISDGIADSALRFLSNNPYLFNVAITRARSALVVIGDQQAVVDSGVDYLEKFALYVNSLNSKTSDEAIEIADYGPEYPTVANPERVSDWEHIFYRALYIAGIRAIPQYDVDQYTVDFALLQDLRKLAIEVDGERYHRDWDGELCIRDQIRNQRLIELGWDVMRFWVYQIRDDLDNCVSRIKKWIETNQKTNVVIETIAPTEVDDSTEQTSDTMQYEKREPEQLIPKRDITLNLYTERKRSYSRYDKQKIWKESILSPFPEEFSPALPYLHKANQLEKEGASQKAIDQELEKARQLDHKATEFYISRQAIINENKRNRQKRKDITN